MAMRTMYVLYEHAEDEIPYSFEQTRQVGLREVDWNYIEIEVQNEPFLSGASDGPSLDGPIFVLDDEHGRIYGEGGWDPRGMKVADFRPSRSVSMADEIEEGSGGVRYIHQFDLTTVKLSPFFKNEEFGNLDPATLFSPETIARWDAGLIGDPPKNKDWARRSSTESV